MLANSELGRQKGKKQVVVYLPPEVHEGLRLQAARSGGTISGLVEEAVRAKMEGQGPRLPLSGETEEPHPLIEALAHYGAPLWSRGTPTALELEDVIAEGLVLARSHPSVLRVLPIVLYRNRSRVRWRRLRARADRCGEASLGMLLDLTAELTGITLFRRWAAELRGEHLRPEPPIPFFVNGPRGARYRELAEQRTPDIVRRWGFLMATPLEDFRAALRRHCPGSPSSTARI